MLSLDKETPTQRIWEKAHKCIPHKFQRGIVNRNCNVLYKIIYNYKVAQWGEELTLEGGWRLVIWLKRG